MAVSERVIPQLYAVVGANREHLSESQVKGAERMQLDVAAWSVQLEQRLLDVVEVLDALAIPFAVLKGCATAHLDHQDPSDRQCGDIDVLIDPTEFGSARRALEREGWVQAYALPRYHERFTHAVTFTHQGMVELDLHQRIAHRALGLLVPTDELLSVRVPFEIAGSEVWALSPPDRMVHAGIHAVASRSGYRRLSGSVDVLVLARGFAGCAGEVLDRAERWRVRPLVEAAIRNVHAEAMLPIPEPWPLAMDTRTRRRDRIVERAYLGDSRRPAVEELAHFRRMDGWADRLLYAYGHLRMDAGPGSGGLVSRLRYLRSRLRRRR